MCPSDSFTLFFGFGLTSLRVPNVFRLVTLLAVSLWFVFAWRLLADSKLKFKRAPFFDAHERSVGKGLTKKQGPLDLQTTALKFAAYQAGFVHPK